tara:strand:- start:276 stop:719 length:444 start_codon:yes stop_codon:yes gene_type:complete
MTGIVWLDRGWNSTRPVTINQTVSEASDLPDYLDADERKRLAERLAVVFNEGDASEIYAVFDELVKTKISLEDVSESLKEMAVLGTVERCVYTHYESQTYGSFPAYVLHYSVSLSGGPFKTGTLDITVIDRGNTYGILAFNVFGGTR